MDFLHLTKFTLVTTTSLLFLRSHASAIGLGIEIWARFINFNFEKCYPRTCNCGFAHPSSLGTMNKKPESSIPLLVTRSISPSSTPGHHDWFNITACDSFGSCTHELKTFESPTFRGKIGAGLLSIDDAVLDRRRPYWVCWDSARDAVIETCKRGID